MHNELQHHGVKGQRWGIRRYQNKNGSLTALGKKHKARIVKSFEDKRDTAIERSKTYKQYTEINKKALAESKKADKASGETSWGTQALTDAYKASGRAYVNSKIDADIYDSMAKALRNDTIKVGQDYTYKLFAKQETVSDSGKAKAGKIMSESAKKYEKELNKYR